MGKDNARPRTRGRSRLGAILPFAMLLGALPARADYRAPHLVAQPWWLPAHVRGPSVLVSLHPRAEGRLQGFERQVREEMEVDLATGVVRVHRTHGPHEISPEWVQDISAATAAAAEHSAITESAKIRSDRLIRAQRADQNALTIDLPIAFPDAVAGVIGQGARLNLTGSERITFAGTSTLIEGGPTFESGNPSAFPDLDMRQQLRVNLDGTIGEKIHVLVNHDSEVSTQLENKIRLRYDGDEDEIIQKIEMGNTDLSLPGAEFLSFRKSQQGLFGAKTEAKVGNLDLTVIASKQEGETASQSFVGRAQQTAQSFWDTDFIRRRYFFVEDPRFLATAPRDASGRIYESVEIYLDDRNKTTDTGDGAVPAVAYMFAESPTDSTECGTVGAQIKGNFHALRINEDYSFRFDTGALTLERTLPADQILAMVAVRVPPMPGEPPVPVGSAAADLDTLRLQVISPPEQELYDDSKGWCNARRQELKNVYSLGGREIELDTFEMTIRRQGSASGQQDEDVQTDPSGTYPDLEYIRIMGLDHRGRTDPAPDLKVEPEFIDEANGLIIFPNLTPFAPDSSYYFDLSDSLRGLNVIKGADSLATGRTPGRFYEEAEGVPLLERNPSIYAREPALAIRDRKYLIEVRYSTPSPSYRLNRFNILEGSERVQLNGRLLQRGVDYDIDYEFGVLTFRIAEASEPDAEVVVDFEFVPLFGQAKESLVGLSGTYNFSPRTWLSSTWLFLSRATPEERPKLGQEPSRTLVGNLYGQWISNPSFMSGFVNAIPFVRTESSSELQLQGEVAMSIPNPNTKDQIYIDDMEGVEDSRDLSITRGVWVPASEPFGSAALGFQYTGQRPLPFNWYNPQRIVRRKEVFPQLGDTQEGQEFIQVLEFGVRENAVPVDSTRWLGIMRNLSPTGEDYSEKKFLEIWVNDFADRDVRDGGAKMIFDMGEISEDFYVETANQSSPFPKGRRFLDTEDVDPEDGELTAAQEDFGLDNSLARDTDPPAPDDDGDDDFEFRDVQPIDYSKINGTEGNRRLDTEDLDGDDFLDESNAHLSYVIDLADDSRYLAQDNGLGFTDENGAFQWRLFRVPLDDGEVVSDGSGTPRRRSVKYVRLWFDGVPADSGRKFQVASVKIVGSAWLEEAIRQDATGEPVTDPNATFLVNVKNNQEHPDYESPPIPLRSDRVGQVEREQTLVMYYDGIRSDGFPKAGGDSTRAGYHGRAYREILDAGGGQGNDWTEYDALSFFLADGSSPDTLPGGSQGSFFFRFGPDTTNFYEFTTSKLPRRATSISTPGWREIFIDLDELTNLKLDPPQRRIVVEGDSVDYRAAVVGEDTLAVFGAPSLARVRRLTLGVRGDDPALSTVAGEVWVNEIRLRHVKKATGYASRISGNARFADFLTLDGGVRRIDSEFRRIEGQRRDTNEFSWNARGDVKLNKFVDGYGLVLPLSADYTYSETIPRLSPNSDIVLESEEDKQKARTVRKASSVSSRFAKTKPSRSRWIRYTVDLLTFSASHGNSDSRGPNLISESITTSGQASYNLSPARPLTFPLFAGYRVNYFPTFRFGANGSVTDRRDADVRENDLGTRIISPRLPVKTRALTATFGMQWEPLQSNTFTSTFNFNKRQDLDLHKDLPLKDSFKRGGKELGRDHNTRLSFRPQRWVQWLGPVLTYETRYREDQGPNVQAPDIPDRKVRRVENQSTREISGAVRLKQIFKKREPPPPARTPRGQPRRPGGDRAGEGQDAGEGEGEPKQEGGGGPGLGSLWNGLVSFTHTFGDLRFSYRDDRRSSYSRVSDRPSLLYQLGVDTLDRSLLIPVSGPAGLLEDNTGQTYSSTFDTSWQPTGNLEGLESRAFLKKLARTSALNSAYRRTIRQSGVLPGPNDAPRVGNWYDLESVSHDFTPLAAWRATWNNGINTTFTVDRSKTTDSRENRGIVSSTITSASSYRLNGRYSFSAPRGISLLGRRIRFSSDLTLNLDVARGQNKVEESTTQANGQSVTNVRSNTKTMNVAPRATYNFSRKLQGSLDISYNRTQDLQRGRKDTIISVALEALIQF